VIAPNQEAPLALTVSGDTVYWLDSAEEAVQARKQIPTLQTVPLVALVFNFVDLMTHGRSESPT
jgi:hypothetical protein